MNSLFEGINDMHRLRMEIDANSLHRMSKALAKQLNKEVQDLNDTQANIYRMSQARDDILHELEEIESDIYLHKKSLRLLSNESKPVLFSIARQIRQIISYHSWLVAAVEVSKKQAYDNPESVFANQSFVCDYNAGVLAAFIVSYNQLYDSLVFSEITRQAILAVNKNNITRENADKIVMVLKVIERYQEQFRVESGTRIHDLISVYTKKIKDLIAAGEVTQRLTPADINKVFEKLIPSIYFIKNKFINTKDLPFPVTHPEYTAFSGELNLNDIKNTTLFRIAAENLFIVDIERANLTPPINLLRTSDFSGKPPLLAKHELYELAGAKNHPIKF